VGASERRDRLLARQQALRERHDELAALDDTHAPAGPDKARTSADRDNLHAPAGLGDTGPTAGREGAGAPAGREGAGASAGRDGIDSGAGRDGADSGAGLDAEVFRRTDALMEVVDEVAAETGRRLLLATFVLLCIAIFPAGLVAFGVLPAHALLGSLLLLAVAVVLGLLGRSMTRDSS
jgi:hypothetical protein